MKHQNRLARASSPYLRQHADNPVDWYEWGDDALQRARQENKPIIVSIGYAACHWCHVMAQESFSNQEIASYMNEHFVCIKVDREERPDIDQIYMDVAHIVSGRGGWPLNAVALPNGQPFYAATYFPPYQWLDVLTQLHDVYTGDLPRVLRAAESITRGIAALPFSPAAPVSEFTPEHYQRAYNLHVRNIDFSLGGYRNAPKFMMPSGLEFFLQYHYFTSDSEALRAVTTSLDAMARGGLNDQIGGGFARYSTDERWLVPHFEKMLYDNAQLISLYSKAFQLTGNSFYIETAEATVAFAERELLDVSGGFYASIDADSEHEEGKFYVWTKAEVDSVCGTDAALVSDFYNVTEQGNWEHGKNILHITADKAIFAGKYNISLTRLDNILTDANRKLVEYRTKRVRPTTDDKILCSWNALMVTAYVHIFRATGKEKYRDGALRTALFISNQLMSSDKASLLRVYKDGHASVSAFLDDYALTASAFIDLYEITFNKDWLDKALRLTNYVQTHFSGETMDVFYYTPDTSEGLIARKTDYSDNVIPASASVLAHVFYRLAGFYVREDFETIARSMLTAVLAETVESGQYYANWAQLLGRLVFAAKEIVITGTKAREILPALQSRYQPDCLYAGGVTENLPLLTDRIVSGKTLIYICENKVCKIPVETAEEALQLLEELH
jgi:uncharacterized protein YyaL (SSP411 family)